MNIVIFGITGSIGQQSIEVIKKLGHKIVGAVFNNNIKVMKHIIDNSKYKFDVYSKSISIFNTVNSIDELLLKTKPDLVINAIPGFDGVEITLKCLMEKIDIALANKESYVVAGWVINEMSKIQKVNVYPVDSEHCAIYDLLKKKRMSKLIITASGGPFYNLNKNDLKKVTFLQAKSHPNWNMGYKISIDSATLMNKCFEIIEAYYIFKTKNIDVVYHPESIVHSMIEFSDNSIHAQMSTPNMKLAIGLAISKFNSKAPLIKKLSFKDLTLNFNVIDENKWLPIKWAKQIIENDDKTLPVILNAANDAAIELFKENKIRFDQIIDIIELTIERFKDKKISNIKDIFVLNSIIKQYILSLYK